MFFPHGIETLKKKKKKLDKCIMKPQVVINAKEKKKNDTVTGSGKCGHVMF